MPEDNNLLPHGEDEGPISTTEEVLRLLREQSVPPNPDEALDNPELEQLLGNLSKGLQEGLDSIPGVQPPGPLTLEELVLGVPSAPPAQESAVCADCGSQNPASTRFCGMCGRELGQSSSTGKVSGNGSEGAVAFEAAASKPQAAAPTRAGQGWKIACLALLCLLFGLAASQQQLWRLPRLQNLISPATPPVPPTPKAPPASTNFVVAPLPASPEPSHPSVPAPSNTAKPSESVSPAPSSPAPTPSKAAPAAKPSAAPSPSLANREAPERAPAIAMAAAPIELPTIIRPPGSSPVLEGAKPVAPARDSSAPKVSQGAVPGALIYRVNPQYPRNARNAHVQGSVVLQATIGTDGAVRQIRAISGNPLLVNAATEAAKQWRYRPFLLDGKPVEGETTITFDFKGE